MTKFFVYIKNNWLWLLVYVLLIYLQVELFYFLTTLLSVCFNTTIINTHFTSACINLVATHGVACCVSVLFIFLYFDFRYFTDLLLYVYSYKLYKGKNNWYKFFRERDKMHKIEDKLAYKEYLKGDNNEKT